MKVFVAGATGAMGRQLVPQLVAAGHIVTGMTRTPAKQDAVRAMGAHAVVADALNPEQVAEAVAHAQPNVIVHELTSLAGAMDIRHFDRGFALTNRLRTEGTDHLLSAGRAVGVRRVVVQSFTSWPYARTGSAVSRRRIRSMRRPRRTCNAPWTRSGTSSAQFSRRIGRKAWCCATAASTALGRRCSEAAR